MAAIPDPAPTDALPTPVTPALPAAMSTTHASADPALPASPDPVPPTSPDPAIPVTAPALQTPADAALTASSDAGPPVSDAPFLSNSDATSSPVPVDSVLPTSADSTLPMSHPLGLPASDTPAVPTPADLELPVAGPALPASTPELSTFVDPELSVSSNAALPTPADLALPVSADPTLSTAPDPALPVAAEPARPSPTNPLAECSTCGCSCVNSGSRSVSAPDPNTFVKVFKGLPWRCPVVTPVKGASDEPWIAEEHKANKYLALLFDVVVVAVISAFSEAHKLDNFENVASYLAFFILVYWMWNVQVHYDARYEAEDLVHRIAKVFQLACFAWLGTATSGWDITKLPFGKNYCPPGDSLEHAKRRIAYLRAEEAFQAAILAFASQRAVLLFQYLWVLAAGRRVGRSIANGHPILTAYYTSGTCAAFAGVLMILYRNSFATWAAMFLLYGSVVHEVLTMAYTLHKGVYDHRDISNLTQRSGSFAIVLLGEGCNNIIKIISKPFTGLNAESGPVIFQVLLAVFLLYLLWGFLFEDFDDKDPISYKRSAWSEIFNFIFHLFLLVFLATCVHNINYGAFLRALNRVITTWGNIFADLEKCPPVFLSVAQGWDLSRHLDSVEGIETPFWKSYETLDILVRTAWESLNNTSPVACNVSQWPSTTVKAALPFSQNPFVIRNRILGELAALVPAAYGFELSDDARETLRSLRDMDITWDPNPTARQSYATSLSEAFLSDITSGLYRNAEESGSLFFPAAGALLVAIVLRSLVRYRIRNTESWAVHFIQTLVGIILLGLYSLKNIKSDTAIGMWFDKEFHIYYGRDMLSTWAYNGYSLAIVTGAFLLTHLIIRGIFNWKLLLRRR